MDQIRPSAGLNPPTSQRTEASMRIGHGYDLHRLEPLAPAGAGKPFILGGVRIPHSAGVVAHSDGDALLHAVTDAILGAVGLPDIGQLFPDNDPSNKSADSAKFLSEVMTRVRQSWEIGNIDCTITCELPKIAPYKAEITANIARILGCPADAVNIKGKTHERVDAVGEGRAIEVHVVALLKQKLPAAG